VIEHPQQDVFFVQFRHDGLFLVLLVEPYESNAKKDPIYNKKGTAAEQYRVVTVAVP